MDHNQRDLAELKRDAEQFSALLYYGVPRQAETLLAAIKLYPYHSFLWEALLDLNDTALVDKATLFHAKNYTAWALRRRLAIPPMHDAEFLRQVFALDERNFHALNYLRRIIEECDAEHVEEADKAGVAGLYQLAHELKMHLLRAPSMYALRVNLQVAPNDISLWYHWFNAGGDRSLCLALLTQITAQDVLEEDIYGPYVAYCRDVLRASFRATAPLEEDLERCRSLLETVGKNSMGYSMAKLLLEEIGRIAR